MFDKTKIWNRIKIVLALSLVAVLFSSTNLAQIISLKEGMLWTWGLISALFFVSLVLLKTLQYWALASSDVSYTSMLKIVIWQNSISNFIATGAGIASYMTMLKTEQNIKLTRSGAFFLSTKFGDLLAVCLYLGLSAGLLWSQIQPLRWLTILLIAGILMGLAAVIITIMWSEHLVALLAKLADWLKLARLSPVSRGIKALQSLTQEEKKPLLIMLRTSVFLSLLYMTATMIFSYTSIMIFNIEISLSTVIYVASLMQLVSYIPVQVLGGLGVAEVTSVYLYSFFGFEQSELSAVMLGLRALFYLFNAATLLYFPFDMLRQRLIRRKNA